MALPLTLLVLAKNEERSIARCIRSARPLAAEIVVMDTGSSDRTKAIARAAGARVIDGRIGGDFARARNRLIAEASQPWILFLDADEMLSSSGARLIARRLRRPSADAFSLEVRHYTDEHNLLDGWTPCSGEYVKEERLSGRSGFYRTARILLFKARPELRFECPVHESLVPAIERSGIRAAPLPAVVHHFEFDKGPRHHARKHRGYLRLALRALATLPRKSPMRVPMLRSAAVDLASTGAGLSRAARLCDAAIALEPRDERHRTLKARIEMLRGRGEAARAALTESIGIRETADALCLAGRNELEMENPTAAARFLNRALVLNPRHPVGLNLKGVLLANEGRLDEALRCFGRALDVHPRYADCLVHRAIVRLELGENAEAARDLRRVPALTTNGALLRKAKALMRKAAR